MPSSDHVIAEVLFDELPNGEIQDWDPASGDGPCPSLHPWETPFSPARRPRGTGFSVVNDEGARVLEINAKPWIAHEVERALVYGWDRMRNYSVTARVKPIDETTNPNCDRSGDIAALVGIVFRWETSRNYYQFGIEGRNRIVLYRRSDDEWFPLSDRLIAPLADYVTLQVDLDGDGIRCRCNELDVEFFCTDTSNIEGKAGVRCHGKARLSALQITENERQTRQNRVRGHSGVRHAVDLGAEIPDPVLVRTLDLNALGGSPKFCDFAQSGRHDILVEGDRLRALHADGTVLWELDECVRNVSFSADFHGAGRLLYGFTEFTDAGGGLSTLDASGLWLDPGELVVIDGANGTVVARDGLPTFDEAVQWVDISSNTGNLSSGGRFDFVLREWRRDTGNGGRNIWAYDRDVRQLWKRTVNPPYGHHHAVQLFDLDGDGRDEVLAGGTLINADGETVWVHDLHDEMDTIHGAGHYDAVAIGDAPEDAPEDTAVFLISGSAGVYVVDGASGRTRMAHRIGHAQGRDVGRIRADLPGRQILVVCRWGNFGILNLFSANGDRLWTVQPDYYGQGSCFVDWDGESYIWMNTSAEVQSLYDGYGTCVKRLPALTRCWGDEVRSGATPRAVRLGTEHGHLLCLTVGEKMYAFGPR